MPATADHIVDRAIGESQHIFGTETSYRDGDRTLQLDATVYDKVNKTLRAYPCGLVLKKKLIGQLTSSIPRRSEPSLASCEPSDDKSGREEPRS